MSPLQQPVKEPLLSVVIPAHNNGAQLRSCLRSLRASDFREYEIIVVDDGSSENISTSAARFGARFARLAARRGPGAARNCGARLARGEYLLFLDSDVCVHADTLARILAAFAADAALDAVFGSYDAQPAVSNFISQYRNLLHHFVHQTANPEASTFWAGCGAMRRTVFLDSGGFDSEYDRPAVEDIELGMRLCRAGARIRVDKRVLVTHQKHWTFWSMLKTDFFHRGLPWARLMLDSGNISNDLNLKWPQRIAAIFAWALIGTLAAGAWQHWTLAVGPLLAMFLVVALDRLTHRPVVAVATGYFVSLVMLVALIAYGVVLGWWVVLPAALSLAIVFVNRDFYRLLAQQRHLALALFVFPLNVLFYLYSSVAFAWAAAQHLWPARLKPKPNPV